MISLDEHDAISMGSNRGFGLVFAAVFSAVAVWPVLAGNEPYWWALAIAAGFLATALLIPHVLAPANRLWFRFGLLLGRIISPVVMAVIFFGAVVPTGLVFKLARKDLLRLKRNPQGQTYWIDRDESVSGSMRDQF